MNEKRKSRRKKEGNLVTIDLISEEESQSSEKTSFAISDDISICGIKILSETLFPIDSLLRIKLTLEKTKKTINMTGKVRWARSLSDKLHEIGIEIEDTTKENIKILFKHLYIYEDEKY